MVDVRTDIWDYLHHHGPTSLDSIASSLGRSRQEIEIAVSHEWFTVQADVVAIAISNKAQVENPRETREKPISERESMRNLRDLFDT